MPNASEIQDVQAAHPIAVVAARTGLSRDVIRVWERRYGAVAPSRSAGRQRLYTDADIRRFGLLAAATRYGRNISLIATLPDDALERLMADDAAAQPAAAASQAPAVTRALDGALDAIAALDAQALDAHLRRVTAREGTPWFLDTFVPGLMRLIGDGWLGGRITIAEEHLASAVVHGMLMETVRSIATAPGSPRLLAATPAGDNHAVGAALVAATATLEGWAVTYLGVNVPAADMVRAATAISARAVAISAVSTAEPGRLAEELHGVRSGLPERVLLIVGGAGGAPAAAAMAAPGVIACNDLPSLRTTLAHEAVRS
jgi:methanogenic corrinoid protein MtbC1